MWEWVEESGGEWGWGSRRGGDVVSKWVEGSEGATEGRGSLGCGEGGVEEGTGEEIKAGGREVNLENRLRSSLLPWRPARLVVGREKATTSSTAPATRSMSSLAFVLVLADSRPSFRLSRFAGGPGSDSVKEENEERR